MEPLRIVPTFAVHANVDAHAGPRAVPQVSRTPQVARPWSDHIKPTEYAVMVADVRTGSPCLLDGVPIRDVNAAPVYIFGGKADAEAWSRQQVERLPELRCRIYDVHGLADQPLEIRDARYHKQDGFSRQTSLRIGLVLLATGIALCIAEWISDFHLSWAAMVGTRLLPVGLLLLVTEGALRLNDWDNRRREAAAGTTPKAGPSARTP